MAELSPLHSAARTGDTDTITVLLDQDSSQVDLAGWMGDTPLHEAAQHGQIDAVRLLLAYGAEVDAYRTYQITPLHWAANAEVARLLIEAGAALETTDEFGITPLLTAVRAGHSDVVQYLLERGARVAVLSTFDGTPLHAAAKRGDLTSAGLLLAAGAEINATEPTLGSTPLHQAVKAADEPMVRFLLEHGASVEIRNKAGQTVIHLARETNQHQLLTLLCQAAPSGPPKELTAQDIHITAIGLHPLRQEAVTTARNGILSRWLLHETIPQLELALQTEHSGFRGLVVSPDGATLIVAVPGNTLEVRAWDDLQVLRSIVLPPVPDDPFPTEVVALAISPDGRWLAVADNSERVYLVDPASGVVGEPVEAGERNYALCFDSSSGVLATACSFQGGGHVRLDTVTEHGTLVPIRELERSSYLTASAEFADTLAHLAFSTRGPWLGLFETSAISHDARPAGWRGDLVLYAMNTGDVQWQASIDARVTGDRRSLAEANYAMGFLTEVLFLDNAAVLCGATGGKLLLYHVSDGSLVTSLALPTTAAICSLAQDVQGAIWIGLDDGTLQITSTAWAGHILA